MMMTATIAAAPSIMLRSEEDANALTFATNTDAADTDSVSTSSASNTLIVGAVEDPQMQQRVHKVEQVLSEELEQLSVEERERIILDVHGVSLIPQTQLTTLEQLQLELSLIEEKPAYDKALQLDPSYVRNPSFQELFLKSTDYQAKEAAQRMVLHFQIKQELFCAQDDDDKCSLVRHVTWKDLQPQDQRMIASGTFRILPQRDVAGRIVVLSSPSLVPSNTQVVNACRAYWYLLMSALLTDPEMQDKGMVFCHVNLLRHTALPPATRQQILRVYSGLPIKTAAMHYAYEHACVETSVVGFQLDVLSFSKTSAIVPIKKKRNPFLLRVRVHHGTQQEMALELQTFGIPTENFPIHTTNQKSSHTLVARHLDWLESIQDWERSFQVSKSCVVLLNTHDNQEIGTVMTTNSNGNGVVIQEHAPHECIIVPRRFDVLLGKTRDTREHPGTLRCLHLVRMHWDAYEAASRRDKTQVADRIIALISECGGRFLKWHRNSMQGGYWVIVEHEVARDKVSHMFRNLRADYRNKNDKRNPKQQPQVMTTTTTMVAVKRMRSSA